MANTKSAIKSNRQSEKRRARNRAATQTLKRALKTLRKAIEGGDTPAATQLLPGTIKLIDSTAGKRAIPRGRANRTKSRIAKAVATAAKS